jgi:hypothetical protein
MRDIAVRLESSQSLSWFVEFEFSRFSAIWNTWRSQKIGIQFSWLSWPAKDESVERAIIVRQDQRVWKLGLLNYLNIAICGKLFECCHLLSEFSGIVVRNGVHSSFSSQLRSSHPLNRLELDFKELQIIPNLLSINGIFVLKVIMNFVGRMAKTSKCLKRESLDWKLATEQSGADTQCHNGTK